MVESCFYVGKIGRSRLHISEEVFNSLKDESYFNVVLVGTKQNIHKYNRLKILY